MLYIAYAWEHIIIRRRQANKTFRLARVGGGNVYHSQPYPYFAKVSFSRLETMIFCSQRSNISVEPRLFVEPRLTLGNIPSLKLGKKQKQSQWVLKTGSVKQATQQKFEAIKISKKEGKGKIFPSHPMIICLYMLVCAIGHGYP